ncbi:disease resistance protein RPS6-like [Bidens hawaiensis]|uniref:disease resistance protein RPS6-like n=1 Tax=Bidens hawaiensis TaxID=980011 RepID=UPI0040491F22
MYVAPNNKLMMHRLLQDMGRSIVDRESPIPAQRSRVWRNKESYDLLRYVRSSIKMKGLALDLHLLMEEEDKLKCEHIKGYRLPSDSLQEMDQLKLLQLNYVEHVSSYKNFSEHLRWLCWHGFNHGCLITHLSLRNLVTFDMSYSRLITFQPPMVLQSLKILNLKCSRDLREVFSISRLPNLETLILWNCHNLTYVCETIKGLANLGTLNMTGCDSMQHSFSFPRLIERLFLKDCKLECTDDFPLTFTSQISLQYLNLGNNQFEHLPSYTHLKNLRVLDLSMCSKLKRLQGLPSTLAELYIYYCESLEKVAFESHQFTLQEFGYEGCSNLSEVEGFIKLVPLAKLDELDLGHMKWLKGYQDHELCLVGDDEIITGRSRQLQMLFEFNIMSMYLLEIKDLNMNPEYMSKSTALSFNVPLCPEDRRLKGLNITIKYSISGENWN